MVELQRDWSALAACAAGLFFCAVLFKIFLEEEDDLESLIEVDKLQLTLFLM